jgi:transcriptional regulator with XRE-family HTH domain
MTSSFIDVGAKIRAYRKRKRLSLTDLSQITGIAASNLSSIELNKSSPTLATLMRIADAFGMKPGAFLDEAIYSEAVHCPAGAGEEVQTNQTGVSVRLVTAGISLGKLDARIITLEKGSVPVDFESVRTDRFVYCLEGRFIARADDEAFSLRAGDSLYLRAEAEVSFEPSASRRATFLLVRPVDRAAE